MTRFWRGSLAAQVILALLVALALSQAIGVIISWGERSKALNAALKGEFFSRTASLALLLEATPADFQSDILRVSGTSYTRFWVSTDGPVEPAVWREAAWTQLARPLPSFKGPAQSPPQVNIVATAALADPPDPGTGWKDLAAGAWALSRPGKFLQLDDFNGMGLAVRLSSGTWLNAACAKPIQNGFWTSQSITSLAITAFVLSCFAIFAARGIARPMRRLAAAAERLGRGETVEPLPESGPDDIRQTAEAFNRMQARIQRFVDDRTRMLAAIGHDLRTPLTTLRLRAEFVTDADLQDKMLKTIAEIQAMAEAALAFAREEATAEDTRAVELSALTESLCDDLAELGHEVAFLESTTMSYRCRPEALRRAIRNIVENAVRYGERARVRLARRPDAVEIVIEDDGPGIPDEFAERVFAPFFRLEHSRNRETGGVGLGLSIARTIVRHHGGDIVLANGASGFSATISLPLPG